MKLGDLNIKGKKHVVLLLLLSTALLLLCRNAKIYGSMTNQWNKAVVYFTRPAPADTTTPSARSNTESKPDVQRCSYKRLSPGNMDEGQQLLDSVTWPETPSLPKRFPLNLTTSGAKSSFFIEPQGGERRVGDELTVKIQMRDYNGNPKKNGGDFLIAKLHNRRLGAGVVGQVLDHLNGTYTAVFPLLWNGTANVEVMLVQTSESITVLKRQTEEEPNRIMFNSQFRRGRVTEKSLCNVCLDPDKIPVCNFTDLHSGQRWFCYKPNTLDCDARVNHGVHQFGQKVSKEEGLLFQTRNNMKVLIKALGDTTTTILPKKGEMMTGPQPCGYYYNNVWRPLRGPTVQPFDNASDITDCLRGKQLHLFGDSTTRQYYEFITRALPNLLMFDKHSSRQCGPFMALDHTNDIMMTFRCHGPPLRTATINVSQLRYVANELDRLSGGPNTAVVIGVWAHFGTFPLEVYYQRLMSIRRAVGRLLNRAPGTKVIVRTGNPKDMNPSNSLFNSDWYSLQRDKVLRAVFKDSGVILLESWEMVQAHYLPHNLHPPPAIIKLMVDMILSTMCPKKGG